MSEIKPALTAEEWNRLQTADAHIDSDGTMWCHSDCGGEPYCEDYEPDRHSLAALALHGQPFGFTQEDVRLLREASEAVGISAYSLPGGPSDALLVLADRIAALMPPEGT